VIRPTGKIGSIRRRHGLRARRASRKTSLRERSKFVCPLKLIWGVQSLAQKYSSFVFTEIDVHSARSAPTQGAYRDRHERGAECGGRGLCRVTSGADADGEVVWSWRA